MYTSSNFPFLPRSNLWAFLLGVSVRSRNSQSYEPLLLENEREAVADLLQYLESAYSFHQPSKILIVTLPVSVDRTTTNFFTGSPLSALTTLSFSDNVDLQRSAALAFAEITEKEVRPVGRDTLDPILFLLSSHDTEVQRAASAALGNLAVNSRLKSSRLIPVQLITPDQLRTSCSLSSWAGSSPLYVRCLVPT